MLRIEKTAVELDEKEVALLREILERGEGWAALAFLERCFYSRIEHLAGGKYRCHTDPSGHPQDPLRVLEIRRGWHR